MLKARFRDRDTTDTRHNPIRVNFTCREGHRSRIRATRRAARATTTTPGHNQHDTHPDHRADTATDETRPRQPMKHPSQTPTRHKHTSLQAFAEQRRPQSAAHLARLDPDGKRTRRERTAGTENALPTLLTRVTDWAQNSLKRFCLLSTIETRNELKLTEGSRYLSRQRAGRTPASAAPRPAGAPPSAP